jgi:hypothetical protein
MQQVGGPNYDPLSDVNLRTNSFGSLDDLTNDGNPAMLDLAPSNQYPQQSPQYNPMTTTNPQSYTVNNHNNSSNDNSSDTQVPADATTAAYLLGFSPYEV